MYPAITLSALPPSSASLRAPVPDGLVALRSEYAEQNRRVRESLLALDNLLSPSDWLDAGDGFPGFSTRRWLPGSRAQDRSHAPVAYLNEEEWRQHVALARDLVTRNHLALGFRDHVSNFIGPIAISFVLRGQTPGASASGPVDADGDGAPDVHPLVKKAHQVWEEFRELNEWGEGKQDREAECRRRLIVEGEATLRLFTGDGNSHGIPYARHIEPELIRTPPGHSTTDRFGWGIITRAEDDECEEGIWICRPDNVSLGREIALSEYVRVKGNADRTTKRGLSDFFPVAAHLTKVLGLLDNMAHVAKLQAAIAWWEQFPNATEEMVRKVIEQNKNYSVPNLTLGKPGRTTDVQEYAPGSIPRTESGRVVVPGPTSEPTGFLAIEAAILRACGFRWGCPSYFSGDADASFASVLVTGSPFVRITESRQDQVKGFTCDVARRVLEFCERSGRLPHGTSQQVRPVATARPVVIADEEKQSRTFLSLYEKNCADPIDFIRKRGGDPKIVAANIAAWQKKFPPGGQQPPDAGTPAPKDPTATPPGSAGGDGTSPNPKGVFGEALKREDRTVTVHMSNGTTYQRHIKGAAADDKAPDHTHELHGDDAHAITSAIDRDVAALPENQRPPAGVVAKAKDLALTAGVKLYEWSVKLSPAAQKIGALIGEILDTPGDMAKLGYNPNVSSGTANVKNADAVSAGLSDALGFGVSGHLVASIASKVLVKAGYWAAKKLRGESIETDDGFGAWAALIAELLSHLNEQMGLSGAPDAATVEKGLRALVGSARVGEHVGRTEEGLEWISESLYAALSEAGRAGLVKKVITNSKGHQQTVYVRPGTATGSERDPHPTDSAAENAITRAVKDPSTLTSADVQALTANAHTLPKERLRQLALACKQKIGGTKAELAGRLLAHVKGQIAAQRATQKQSARELDARTDNSAGVDGAVAAAAKSPSLGSLRSLRYEVDKGRSQRERVLDDWSGAIEAFGRVLDSASADGGSVAAHGMPAAEATRKLALGGIEVHWPDTPAGRATAVKTLLDLTDRELSPKLLAATGRVVLSTQKNKDDVFWAKKYQNPGHVSAATGGDGTVVAYNGWGINTSTFAHEAGHNLATKVWGKTAPAPDSEYGLAQSKEPPVSEYAKNSPDEDFAEAVALYSGPTGVRAKFKAAFPLKHAALEQLLKGP